MERIVVPPRLRTWSEDGWHIYFDPYNFIWTRVNDSGKFLLEEFRKYRTIPDIIINVSERYKIPTERADEIIKKFVDNLIGEGFLHRDAYVSATAQNFRSWTSHK